MEEIRNEKGQTLKEFLETYDADKYKHPSCTVDMILMTIHEGELKILLVKRKDHPFIGDWATPGGFIGIDEDMDAAVQRELAEETNITKDTYFRQLYTFGKSDRDPRTRVITTAYLSLTPESNIKETRAGDDAADAAWFTIKKNVDSITDKKRVSTIRIDSDERGLHMAYSVVDSVNGNYIQTASKILPVSNVKLAADHIKAINIAMDEVQHKAISSGIIFNLLPKEVTLLQIRKAYEAIVGHEVHPSNFNRSIANMLVETKKTNTYRGRPVRVFRFNPLYQFIE